MVSPRQPKDQHKRGLVNTKHLGLAVASCAAAGLGVTAIAEAARETSEYGNSKWYHDTGPRGGSMITGSPQSPFNRARNIYGGTIVIQAHYSPSVFGNGGTAHYGYPHSGKKGVQESSHFSHKADSWVWGRCWNGTSGNESLRCTEGGYTIYSPP
jgi:hypothetical protein